MEHKVEGPVTFGFRMEGLTESIEIDADRFDRTADLYQLIFASEAAFGHFISELALVIRWNLERFIRSIADIPNRELILEALGLPGQPDDIETTTAPQAVRDLLLRAGDRGAIEAEFPVPLIVVQWAGGGIELFATQAAFEPGSWKQVIGGGVIGFFGGLMCVPATHAYDNHIQSIRWEKTAQATVCRARIAFSIDLDQVRATTADQFDFDEPGISIREKELRICRVQLALLTLGFATGDVDGQLGETTKAALQEFAKSVHAKPGDWQSKKVMQALAFAFSKKRLDG